MKLHENKNIQKYRCIINYENGNTIFLFFLNNFASFYSRGKRKIFEPKMLQVLELKRIIKQERAVFRKGTCLTLKLPGVETKKLSN